MNFYRSGMREYLFFAMRLFCGLFFLYLAISSLGDLKMIRDGFFGFGFSWQIAGLLSYLYSGLLFALAFSFLLKPEWHRPAAMLAVFCVVALLITVVRDALGGSGCKACPSVMTNAAGKIRMFLLFILYAGILFQTIIIYIGYSDSDNRQAEEF